MTYEVPIEDVHQIVRTWTTRLGLDGWRVAVTVEAFEPVSTSARVRRSSQYRDALVQLQPFTIGAAPMPDDHLVGMCGGYDQRRLEALIVHELLHIVTVPMARVHDMTAERLPYKSQTVANDAWELAEEQVIDDLAFALVDAFPRFARLEAVPA